MFFVVVLGAVAIAIYLGIGYLIGILRGYGSQCMLASFKYGPWAWIIFLCLPGKSNCPNCNNPLAVIKILDGKEVGGVPGIYYMVCNKCGGTRALTTRPLDGPALPGAIEPK